MLFMNSLLNKVLICCFGVVFILAGKSLAADGSADVMGGSAANINSPSVEAIAVLGCLIEPKTTTELSVSARGNLGEIMIKRGDIVGKGDVLAHLETSVEELNVKLARLRAEMNMELEAQQARLELAEHGRRRASDLAAKNLISTEKLDEAITQATVARLEVLSAKERKAQAQVELQLARAVLKRRYIHSTVNGIVVELYKEVGEFVDEEAVLKLAEINPLRVDVIAPVTMFGSFKKGMVVEITPELEELGTYPAVVDVVDRVIDPASGTFRIILELKNPDYTIPAGLNCRLSIKQTLDKPLQPINMD